MFGYIVVRKNNLLKLTDMKKTAEITSVESKAGFPEALLEKFVQENLPAGAWIKNKTKGMGNFTDMYSEIESCAAETPIGGSVEIFVGTRRKTTSHSISVPVNSRFFVYCTRKERDHYRVSWCCSIS